jgi:hypothetical protein
MRFFIISFKKNYFLSESTTAVAAESTVAAAESTIAVAVESTAATVESAACSVLEVQAAKEATHATNKIAITFFIVFVCGVLRFETHCKFKTILRYQANFS